MKSIGSEFLYTAIKRLNYYKGLGDNTFAQLSGPDFHVQPNAASNSIAVIIRHLSGNMLSRWTNFLAEDGEKDWRNRDDEFELHHFNKEALLDLWEKGWSCFIDAVQSLHEEDLLKLVYIRREPLTVIDAINRQMAHYPYHVGQIVYIGRMIKDQHWQSLSIPKGQSEGFNRSDGIKDPANR